MEKLDLTDRKILHELDLNARVPVKKLARKLRQSREKVDYRINRLVERGVIRKFVAMINPGKLGFSAYKMYFKFQNMPKEKERGAIDWLVGNGYVYWVASVRGRWDITFTIFAKNINHFDSIISEFISIYGNYIQEQEYNETLQAGILSKDWLMPDEAAGNIVLVGGENKDIGIDRIDYEILKILANNARMSSAELARRIKSTQRKVIYRIRQLEKKDIILGYTTSLDLEKIKMQFFKAIVHFNVMSSEMKKKVVSYCQKEPHIGFLVFCVGSWPLEIELLVDDNTHFYEVMEKFREAFPESRGYETIIFPVEHKFNWMPMSYKPEK